MICIIQANTESIHENSNENSVSKKNYVKILVIVISRNRFLFVMDCPY